MRRRRLSSQILAFQVLILGLTCALGLWLAIHTAQDRVDQEAESRALAVAHSIQAMPALTRAVAADNRSGVVQARAMAIQHATGSSFVVITNRRGIRLSHPNPKLIGKLVSTSPEPALHGKTVLAIETGTLGRSARAKVPLRVGNRIVGEVSVGTLATKIQRAFSHQIPSLLLYALALLALALIGSLLFARWLKRQTFGLELREIRDLFSEREAVLWGIREAVVAVDKQRRIRVVNRSAERLLGLSQAVVNRSVDELEDQRLVPLIGEDTEQEDAVLVLDDRVLVANRRPVRLDAREIGTVITVRDRTELERLSRKLSGVMTVADALRAQKHEFANRLQTIGGLLHLNHPDQALDYVGELQRADQNMGQTGTPELRNPLVQALLSAKSAVAGERGVDLRVDPESSLPEQIPAAEAVLSILGNLIDNALDAVTGTGEQGDRPWVAVRLATGQSTLAITVKDSGPGIPVADRERIFELGYSTKQAADGLSRGIGLSLVRRHVEELGGTIAVLDQATFEVVLPNALIQEVST